MNVLLDSKNIAVFLGEFGEITVNDNHQFQYQGAILGQFNVNDCQVVDVMPPPVLLNEAYKLEGDAWVCVDQAAVDGFLVGQKITFNQAQKEKRAAAYRSESDPLFFKYQREEATKEEWLSKVAEITARYPYQA